MHALYKDLAKVYEAMYQTFINYPEEYRYYSKLLNTYGKNQVLEIGSGTGNLAALLIKNGFRYTGLDLSPEMIELAQSKLPDTTFLQGDMRNFSLEKPVQSILIPGRTISYLHTNQDVNAAFSSMHNNLRKDGMVCFDFIDANQFIPKIAKGLHIQHKATYQNIAYRRESDWSLELSHGMAFNWEATYFQKKLETWTEIGKDQSLVRTFTKDEMLLFLQINNFKVKAVLSKTSYAFPTYVIVAKKA